MTQIDEVRAQFDPRSATSPTDLIKQATDAWMQSASQSGVEARRIGQPDSVGFVEHGGSLYSLDFRNGQIEAHPVKQKGGSL